jgi:ABC-type anion transport system duplicated permease subunit
VTSSGIASIQYTATYIGTLIEEPVEETHINVMAFIIPAVLIAILLAAVLLYLTLLRTNTTVYRQTGNDNEYEKCGKLRLSVKEPELLLEDLKTVPDGMIAVEIAAPTAKKLFGKTIQIVADEEVFKHTVDRTDGDYWFKLDVSGSANTISEEEPV